MSRRGEWENPVLFDLRRGKNFWPEKEGKKGC